MYIHGAAVAEVVKAPHLIQQLVAGVDPVGRGGQVIEQLQLLGGSVHFLSVHDQLVRIQVDNELIEHQLLGGIVGDLRPAKHRIDPGDELFHLKGLDNVVVGPHLQSLDTIEDLAFGCQHDNGNLGGLPDLGTDRPTIHHRQHDVQQNQIRFLFLELLDGLSAISGNADIKPFLHQIHVNEFGDIAVILHHQDITSHGDPSILYTSLILLYPPQERCVEFFVNLPSPDAYATVSVMARHWSSA